MTQQDAPTWMREAEAAEKSGDVERFLDEFKAQLSPDCTFRVPGASSLAGVLEGHEGVSRFFRTMFERSNGTFKSEVLDVLASPEHMVIFLRVTAETPDGPVDVRVAQFATLGPDGKSEHLWFLPSDVAMHDRLLR